MPTLVHADYQLARNIRGWTTVAKGRDRFKSLGRCCIAIHAASCQVRDGHFKHRDGTDDFIVLVVLVETLSLFFFCVNCLNKLHRCFILVNHEFIVIDTAVPPNKDGSLEN